MQACQYVLVQNTTNLKRSVTNRTITHLLVCDSHIHGQRIRELGLAFISLTNTGIITVRQFLMAAPQKNIPSFKPFHLN